MLDFMDYIQLAFAEATDWNRDNSYSSLTATAQSLLDFKTPERLRVHLSSLSTPHFATSYTLGTVGLIDGSVSYLYSTVPFDNTPSRSALIPLRKLAPGYRQVQAPVAPVENWGWDSVLDGIQASSKHSSAHDASSPTPLAQKATLLNATLHLPPPTTLNALFLRRISPTMQLTLAVCSTRGPPLSKSAPQASLLTQLSHDTGKYSNEYLFSTDNALFGWRGLWNFGPDPRTVKGDPARPRLSLLSAGAEAYYSPVSSLIGMSTGLRFSTLPAATDLPSSITSTSTSTSASTPNTPPSSSSSNTTTTTNSSSSSSSSSTNNNNTHPISTFPYTLTLTLTPLTGSLSTTYSLRASPNLAFSSRFGFNVYSWESEMVAGCELWRGSPSQVGTDPDSDGLEWARRKMRTWEDPLPSPTSPSYDSSPSSSPVTIPERSPSPTISNVLPPGSSETEKEEEANGSVIKIRVDQSWNVRLLWEGRVKELLVSAGVGLGPSSFSGSCSSWSSANGSGQSAGGGGGPGKSYWRGVGVSVLYSS